MKAPNVIFIFKLIKQNPNAFEDLYKIKRLNNDDKIESFDCGNDDLNDVGN